MQCNQDDELAGGMAVGTGVEGVYKGFVVN